MEMEDVQEDTLKQCQDEDGVMQIGIELKMEMGRRWDGGGDGDDLGVWNEDGDGRGAGDGASMETVVLICQKFMNTVP